MILLKEFHTISISYDAKNRPSLRMYPSLNFDDFDVTFVAWPIYIN